MKERFSVISKPPFRDFRVRQSAVNASVLYPNRVGAKFSDEEITVLKDWAKQNDLYVASASPTKLELIRTDANPLDLSMHGVRGVKAEAYVQKKLAEERAREKKRVETYRKFSEYPSSAWIENTFGKDFTNPYNKLALARFLDGETKEPVVVISWRWKDGFEKSRAIDGNKINWKRVKEAYEKERRKRKEE